MFLKFRFNFLSLSAPFVQWECSQTCFQCDTIFIDQGYTFRHFIHCHKQKTISSSLSAQMAHSVMWATIFFFSWSFPVCMFCSVVKLGTSHALSICFLQITMLCLGCRSGSWQVTPQSWRHHAQHTVSSRGACVCFGWRRGAEVTCVILQYGLVNR